MQRILSALVVLGAACWLCIYPVFLVAAGLALLVVTPQGNELLDWSAAFDSLAYQTIFHFSILAWALSAWYCSRLLLGRRFGGRFGSAALESDDAFTIWVRKWLPRLLGAAVYAALAAYYYSSASRFDAALLFASGVAYWLFVVYRRRVLRNLGAVEEQKESLDPTMRLVLAGALALSFALLAGFLASPVALPRFLGAAPIILFAFTSWILFGSIVLVLAPKARGLPSLAPLPLVLMLAAGGVDNHELRRVPSDPAAQRAASIEASALEWLHAHEADFRRAREAGEESFPVYIVSAEGGGLRAAYWTASVLGELNDATDGAFARHLFAISGVSGGSLGAAAFVAELDAECDGMKNAVRDCVRRFLQADFLSPVVAYLLFPDFLQRFMPFTPVRSFDRARALELSWERSWSETHPRVPANRFAQSYAALAKPGTIRLFLNATRVETGKRVLVSPARFDADEVPEVDDLLAVGGKSWAVPLSTAVHLSARFSYVSPAAKICNAAQETCDGEAIWGRLVDGGYHENSGAQTATDVMRALRRAARAFEAAQPAGRTRIVPQAVIITNDPASARICDAMRDKAPARHYSELLSPLQALWNARAARGSQARRNLADAAAGARRDPLDKDCAGDGTRSRTLEFALAEKTSDDAPALGWFLALGSVRQMNEALCRAAHVQAIALARRELGAAGDYDCGSAGRLASRKNAEPSPASSAMMVKPTR